MNFTLFEFRNLPEDAPTPLDNNATPNNNNRARKTMRGWCRGRPLLAPSYPYNMVPYTVTCILYPHNNNFRTRRGG